MDLVTAIVEEPAFLADEAVMAKVRTPLEKVVGIAQAFGLQEGNLRFIGRVLRTMGYIPFAPPNVAGFPKGDSLLDPHRMIHTFDFATVLPEDVPMMEPEELMSRLGVVDISTNTREVLAGVDDAGGRTALAINSPEFHLT
jgi:uncharacterized protein (DUF1800 family)